jgi:hypothetical protein
MWFIGEVHLYLNCCLNKQNKCVLAVESLCEIMNRLLHSKVCPVRHTVLAHIVGPIFLKNAVSVDCSVHALEEQFPHSIPPKYGCQI